LIFWGGSGGCGIMKSETFQDSAALIQKVLISLILQRRDHFVHQLITLREEIVCAVFSRLINLNKKFLAQAQRRCFASENEILDQNLDRMKKNMDLYVSLPRP
jgi:hypothetical protein